LLFVPSPLPWLPLEASTAAADVLSISTTIFEPERKAKVLNRFLFLIGFVVVGDDSDDRVGGVVVNSD